MTTEHQDLDGMTVNRDAKRMTAELRQWRAAHARAEARTKAEPGFAGAFADIFGKGFAK